jgi:hypothetical protein
MIRRPCERPRRLLPIVAGFSRVVAGTVLVQSLIGIPSLTFVL